jgi:hypothetical protein
MHEQDCLVINKAFELSSITPRNYIIPSHWPYSSEISIPLLLFLHSRQLTSGGPIDDLYHNTILAIAAIIINKKTLFTKAISNIFTAYIRCNNEIFPDITYSHINERIDVIAPSSTVIRSFYKHIHTFNIVTACIYLNPEYYELLHTIHTCKLCKSTSLDIVYYCAHVKLSTVNDYIKYKDTTLFNKMSILERIIPSFIGNIMQADYKIEHYKFRWFAKIVILLLQKHTKETEEESLYETHICNLIKKLLELFITRQSKHWSSIHYVLSYILNLYRLLLLSLLSIDTRTLDYKHTLHRVILTEPKSMNAISNSQDSSFITLTHTHENIRMNRFIFM